MVIYILTKCGADWLIFVDARVLTRKLWTDGRWTDARTDGRTDGQRWTVSDHNSSQSTPCSGELKSIGVRENVEFSGPVLADRRTDRQKDTSNTIRPISIDAGA